MFSAAIKTDNVSSGGANYIEDVFSTYLYTGNGSTQTITNGIDLAGKGGLVWLKSRTNPPSPYDDFHRAVDTVRGTNSVLYPNSTSVADPFSYVLTSFNSNGFTIGNGTYDVNKSGYNYVSWAFREQPKFFDVVTYTGDGTSVRTISHNLGSTPGFIIIKCTSASGDWSCYHQSLGVAGGYIKLNSTAAASGTAFADPINSTVFSIEAGAPASMNTNGATYVAYLFAHNAGGFGLTGTDNVISCGSYVGNGSATGPVITLGYEPQWILVKRTTDGIEDWEIYDNMRGIVPAGADQILYPNNSTSEQSATRIQISATGFSPDGTAGSVNAIGKTYIYIAIRRGPMKTPTSGTSVFSPIVRPGSGANSFTTGFPVDLSITVSTDVSNQRFAFDRLRGSGDSAGTVSKYSFLNTNTEETSQTGFGIGLANNTGFSQNWWSSQNTIFWSFRRAPGFFDEVCYTGTGSSTTVTHNLGVAPELIIVKSRSPTTTPAWTVYVAPLGISNGLNLNTDGVAGSTASPITSTNATTMDIRGFLQENTKNYFAYLFATCPGVSKVGSYTGTGALQTINCGFAAGARFVLIKRTDVAGDWYVWDSARGISSGNDPYLLINSTTVEVTGTNYVDTTAVGFQVTAAAPAELNASGGTYIFLAIA